RAQLGPEERIRFLSARVSAYQFLIRCLQRTGNLDALFDAENAMRARGLAETLNLGTPPAAISLATFQQTLAADEAAVFYTLTGPAEIVAHIVTRNSSSVTFQDGRGSSCPSNNGIWTG
ncbi:MAG TPA: hypothetical protein VHF69_01750, partial [Candidatus Synoicihabitans sp.]|nr:hypothetical protein [Candidatus Synoicihabitans sp.]